LKETDDIFPNILEVMNMKEDHYGSMLEKRKNGEKRYYLASLIKLSEKKEIILDKIKNLCSREWGKYIEEDNINGSDFN
jgi:hypothetical protein